MSATQGRGLASLRTAGTARREAADRQALLRTPLTQDGPPTAVFDFDKTLTVRDTFLPWLTLLRGRRRTLAAGLGALRAGLSGVSRGGSISGVPPCSSRRASSASACASAPKQIWCSRFLGPSTRISWSWSRP